MTKSYRDEGARNGKRIRIHKAQPNESINSMVEKSVMKQLVEVNA